MSAEVIITLHHLYWTRFPWGPVLMSLQHAAMSSHTWPSKYLKIPALHSNYSSLSDIRSNHLYVTSSEHACLDHVYGMCREFLLLKVKHQCTKWHTCYRSIHIHPRPIWSGSNTTRLIRGSPLRWKCTNKGGNRRGLQSKAARCSSSNKHVYWQSRISYGAGFQLSWQIIMARGNATQVYSPRRQSKVTRRSVRSVHAATVIEGRNRWPSRQANGILFVNPDRVTC